MIPRSLAAVALLASMLYAGRVGLAQTADSSAVRQSGAQSVDPSASSEPGSGRIEEQQPRVVVTVPPPQPAPWGLRERIAWGAGLALAAAGYIGIVMALSLLRKIERSTRATETVATAAAEQAHTALVNAEAMIAAERPWLLISVEPSRTTSNSFTVTATNRGHSPARIVSGSDDVRIAADETALPPDPEYHMSAPLSETILLPGESTGIRAFGRDDLAAICGSEQVLKRVENWEEKVFLYGRVLYQNLISRPAQPVYETSWCCWYIHGRQKSGMVKAGPASYSRHT